MQPYYVVSGSLEHNPSGGEPKDTELMIFAIPLEEGKYDLRLGDTSVPVLIEEDILTVFVDKAIGQACKINLPGIADGFKLSNLSKNIKAISFAISDLTEHNDPVFIFEGYLNLTATIRCSPKPLCSDLESMIGFPIEPY